MFEFLRMTIQHGLTAQSVRWTFQTETASNWHPLAWLSHLADMQLYRTNTVGHHFAYDFTRV
jgi:hypothetical protein